MQEELIAVLTDEHRQLREVLLDLIDAFENSDSERVSEGIEEMAALAGPHFYYEQEALPRSPKFWAMSSSRPCSRSMTLLLRRLGSLPN
jgi:hypothetical protein